MPQRGQQDKQQCLYLVTALVQMVTRKQPATIIHPQPPSGGPLWRARRDEAMAAAPLLASAAACGPHARHSGPGLLGTAGSGHLGRETGAPGVRTRCTCCNPNGSAPHPASALPAAGNPAFSLMCRLGKIVGTKRAIRIWGSVWCHAFHDYFGNFPSTCVLARNTLFPSTCRFIHVKVTLLLPVTHSPPAGSPTHARPWPELHFQLQSLLKLVILPCTQFSAKVLLERIQFSPLYEKGIFTPPPEQSWW